MAINRTKIGFLKYTIVEKRKRKIEQSGEKVVLKKISGKQTKNNMGDI